jgi:hypothetical protein
VYPCNLFWGSIVPVRIKETRRWRHPLMGCSVCRHLYKSWGIWSILIAPASSRVLQLVLKNPIKIVCYWEELPIFANNYRWR